MESMHAELAALRGELERERNERIKAERLAERKEEENGRLTNELRLLNDRLEAMVSERTAELEKARDEAVEANRTKSQFLANMSHELRTPLNAIIGYSEMLREEAEEADVLGIAEDLGKIHQAGKHLLTLINDILDLSKIEAGKMDLYLETCDLPSLIQDVVTTVTPLIEQKGNRLTVEVQPGELRTDVTKLRQILFNLLSNAGKFTSEGSISLTAAFGEELGKPGVLFRVKDTGIGMTEEQMDHLFQAFRQADSSTTKKYGGTGLGLAISQKLCHMLEGRIEAASVFGQGSTFSVYLPLLREEEQEAGLPSAPFGAKAAADTVLVIDDDPTALHLMQRLLGKEGCSVALARSGQEGIRLARELQPKLISLDVLMPGMDGWSVLAELKNDPQTASIPVIMISMTDEKSLGYALGASEFLTKPVYKERLIAALDKYVPKRQVDPILIIEDDATTSQMMTYMLEREGYRVHRAEDGQKALDLLEKLEPKLILLDLMMPNMDGFEFVEKLRERRAGTSGSLPIIVLTAKDITEEDRRRLNGFAEKIVQKGSFRRERLLEEIRFLLNGAGRESSRPAEKGD
ncbi:hybrid sensor histidine kinase/response regulator [Cohnella thailandensis]|uniref:Circadian input-output histidine kinase CikA n=1 Tax=Cohnella thailandensis TaxID=557557 RepID=A0A841SX21_9BACL|nr:response regulator [Cohnella thailandensis]MBB6634390.1 response regulator [Cohnella thailandensis]MBP1972110.1 signal transduction histidine kinase/CheY-like chemotaxis protein [Cohnella thailandensis]